MRAKFPALVILGALLVACSDAPAPTAPADLTGDALFTVLAGAGPVYVLNAQLRPVANADESPPSTAWGHIQVKLRYMPPPDDQYSVSAQGIVNLDEETVTVAGIYFGPVPPEVIAAAEVGRLLITMNRVTTGGRISTGYGEHFFGETTLDAAEAEEMIALPANYFAWFGTSEGAIAGRTQPGPGGITIPEGTGTVTGTVTVAGTSTPIAGVRVILNEVYWTGEDGTFSFADVHEGLALIYATKSGFEPYDFGFSVEADETTVIDIGMSPLP
jgi:hypothetical protein